jgi:hypothetical protein
LVRKGRLVDAAYKRLARGERTPAARFVLADAAKKQQSALICAKVLRAVIVDEIVESSFQATSKQLESSGPRARRIWTTALGSNAEVFLHVGLVSPADIFCRS